MKSFTPLLARRFDAHHLAIAGALPARSDGTRFRLNQQSEDRQRTRPVPSGSKPLSYRSPGAAHKLMLHQMIRSSKNWCSFALYPQVKKIWRLLDC